MWEELKITFIILMKIYDDIVNLEQEIKVKPSNIDNKQRFGDLNKLLAKKRGYSSLVIPYDSTKIQQNNKNQQNTGQLVNQIQSLKNQVQLQNNKDQQELQCLFEQVINLLKQANQKIISINFYMQITEILNQMQQQLIYSTI